MKPHQYKGWLNSKDKLSNPEEFNEKVKVVCEVYKNAKALENEGIHVICVDEKTGIQAIEHKNPSKPMKIGEVEKVEQEYKRRGTTGIIASRNVATGEIIAPLIQPTRTEEDFIKHIENVVHLEPEHKYIFVMDQLNTHKSESLVRYIASQCGIGGTALGEKGKSGILKDMESRATFLSDENHRIRIVYTPRHSSWLNQIEIWFGIITRKILNKRASFKTVTALESKIIEFIDFYNKVLAKPFKWTYAGKVLHA